jgi:hypothetical protein
MNMAEALHFHGLRGALKRDEPMSRHVSWRTGGPADRLYMPADLEDLGHFLRTLQPLHTPEAAMWRSWFSTHGRELKPIGPEGGGQ